MKETKELLLFLLSLHMTVDKAKADGKIGTEDLGLLMDPLSKAVPALTDMNLIEAEIMNKTPEQHAELMADLKGYYDIADDALEKKVEEGLALVLHIAKFVYTVKA